jgi:hypothetical protein
MWASTLSDFVRMSVAGEILGRVVVYYAQGLRWTSDALTSDGTHLWGHLPRTVQDATGLHNRSLIIEFAKDGTVTNEFEIPHRTNGLARGASCGLSPDATGFKRFDATGNILESIDVFLPDLSDLEYDGTYFWCIGWFLSRLYQIDRSGEIVRVFDLPQDTGTVVPVAIAHDGSLLWYAEGKLFAWSSRIYKLQVSAELLSP